MAETTAVDGTWADAELTEGLRGTFEKALDAINVNEMPSTSQLDNVCSSARAVTQHLLTCPYLTSILQSDLQTSLHNAISDEDGINVGHLNALSDSLFIASLVAAAAHVRAQKLNLAHAPPDCPVLLSTLRTDLSSLIDKCAADDRSSDDAIELATLIGILQHDPSIDVDDGESLCKLDQAALDSFSEQPLSAEEWRALCSRVSSSLRIRAPYSASPSVGGAGTAPPSGTVFDTFIEVASRARRRFIRDRYRRIAARRQQ